MLTRSWRGVTNIVMSLYSGGGIVSANNNLRSRLIGTQWHLQDGDLLETQAKRVAIRLAVSPVSMLQCNALRSGVFFWQLLHPVQAVRISGYLTKSVGACLGAP